MTPNEIEVLIHYHVSPEPHPRVDSGAVQYALDMFVENGIITYNGQRGYYETTDRGKALVEALCNTPFPVERWVDPRFERNSDD